MEVLTEWPELIPAIEAAGHVAVLVPPGTVIPLEKSTGCAPECGHPQHRIPSLPHLHLTVRSRR